MKSNNGSFLADLYRRVGERLGLLEGVGEINIHGEDSGVHPLSAEDAAEAEVAYARMRKRARDMKLGLTAEDIVALAHEGRR